MPDTSEQTPPFLLALLPRIERLERGHDACHSEVRGLREAVTALEGAHADHVQEITVIEQGYQLILREVRETRSAVETLFTTLAQEKLEASRRHAELLKQAGRGIFWLSAMVVTMSSVHGIITGQPLPESLMSIWHSMLGTGN